MWGFEADVFIVQTGLFAIRKTEDQEAPGRSFSPHVCGLPFHVRTRVIYAADCCAALTVFQVAEEDESEKMCHEKEVDVDACMSAVEMMLNFRSQAS